MYNLETTQAEFEIHAKNYFSGLHMTTENIPTSDNPRADILCILTMDGPVN